VRGIDFASSAQFGKSSTDSQYMTGAERWIALTLGATAILALSGCTVESHAALGFGVASDGTPVGFLQVCSEHIDGVTVYKTDRDHIGTWTVQPSAVGFATWSLVSGGNGWTVTEALALKPGQSYHSYGWTNDNSSSAAGPDITSEQLAAMTPGQVLWDGQDGGQVTSLPDFKAHACDRYQ
jgi:hypothetical protein